MQSLCTHPSFLLVTELILYRIPQHCVIASHYSFNQLATHTHTHASSTFLQPPIIIIIIISVIEIIFISTQLIKSLKFYPQRCLSRFIMLVHWLIFLHITASMLNLCIIKCTEISFMCRTLTTIL